jgi:hypothetical protein
MSELHASEEATEYFKGVKFCSDQGQLKRIHCWMCMHPVKVVAQMKEPVVLW